MLRTTRQAKVQSAPTLAKKPLRRSLNPIVTIWLSVTFTAIVLGVVQTELSLHSGEESAALQESFLWSSPSLEKQQPSSSYFVSRPRQVSLVLNGTSSQAWFESYHFIEPIQVQVSLEVSNFKQAGRTYENAKIIDPPPPETGNCIPMGEWQSSIFPNCNSAHEISLQPGRYVEFINCGGDRCAFQLSDDSNSIVLKIPKWSRDFEEHDFRKAAKDGVAMEHLSHSNYILDIYGYCGLSQVIELGDKGGNLHDLIKTTKYQTRPFVSDLDKLKIGYQIASAVSDMHGPDPSLIPIAHNDICCHQFILVNGIYKLNDFHLAAFQKRNKQTGTTCPGKNWYSRHVSSIA